MVTEFGMSDRLGPLSFGKRDELVFLGREIGEQRNYSDDVARQIDEEVRAIIDRAYERATDPHDHRGPGRREGVDASSNALQDPCRRARPASVRPDDGGTSTGAPTRTVAAG
jgi:hypothetical protein